MPKNHLSFVIDLKFEFCHLYSLTKPAATNHKLPTQTMREIFEEFAKKIVTKEDLIFFLEEINLVRGLIFKNINIPLSERAEGKIDESFREYLKELEKKKIISKNPEENQVFFEKFKKYLQNIPQIKIEVAFQPNKGFTNKVSLWLKKEIKQEVILDLIFNPEVAGGAIIEYQGKRVNFSLAKKIDELERKIKG